MTTPTRRRFGLQMIATGAAAAAASVPARADDGAPAWRAGRVYTSTNAAGGNMLLVYAPADDGSLQLQQTHATQGLGTGAGLGSQGAVTLSGDGRHLFVVNAGSHTVSSFALERPVPELVSVAPSGGLMPTSVAESGGLVYVLNAGGDGNVAGLRNLNGELQALPGSTRGLSAAGGTAPGQVGFGSVGDVLVVTERATNRLSSWRVRRDGTLGPLVVTPSAGVTPFGFAFNQRDQLFVSEAFAGVPNGSATSSYRFDQRAPATPVLVSASVPTLQGAACWLVVSPNGQWAYTANAGNSSVSSYHIARDGSITLAQSVAGVSANAGATDMALSAGGRRLYLLAARGQRIVGWRPLLDGMLEPTTMAIGLPAGCVGLAAD